MELLVPKKSMPIHSKLGDKAERSSSQCFWRFDPENILNIKRKEMLFKIGYRAIRKPLAMLEGPA